MKKYITCLLFTFSAVIAFATPLDYAHLIDYEEVNRTFLDHIISGKKATYTICEEISLEDVYLHKWMAKKLFNEAIDNWFYTTKRYIKNNKDFKDIVTILENKKNIEEVPCDAEHSNVDLKIIIKADVSEECGQNLACYNPYKERIYIPTKGKPYNYYERYFTHELGHAFGLADLYNGIGFRQSFIYNSKIYRPSVMRYSDYVTCDDADGLITVIDRMNNKERTFGSLCRDNLIIVNGRGQTKYGNKFYLSENMNIYDTDITVSYNGDQAVVDEYFLSVVLKNFNHAKWAEYTLTQMGFNIDGIDFSNPDVLKEIEVQFTGTTIEKPHTFTRNFDEKSLRTPLGLWTFTLFINKELKQIISTEYTNLENITSKRFTVATGVLEKNKNCTYIPLLNVFHFPGQTITQKIKAELRKSFKKMIKNIIK